MELPGDSHVHSEFSWDTGGPDSAAAGRMTLTCERAAAIGLRALIFTEHVDLDSWITDPDDVMGHQTPMYREGRFHPLRFQADRYFEAIDRCRLAFPDLRILAGIEYGQPHRSDDRVADVVDLTALDRVNGSLHTLPFRDDRAEPNTMFRHLPAADVMWAYLEEIPRMIASSSSFSVFTHIDYAVRSWPVATEGPFDPARFEEGFRGAMRAIAHSGRALELNTRRLGAWQVQWWAEEGGREVTFGSDAHDPTKLANGFPEAALLAESVGFQPGSRPEDPWRRR
ncbi:PHP domain-containing protein [Bogoriella caseilytica]|uniref:Histidinol-phosphatase (PHP family) n=1 Tax=Bogoriella caseilytica TaxID=56055 RepID=A0A3N2BCN7_9MICO|nr:PHP domain-containing protein [Bogoriella caseilytica]ROR72998.1 histidinol-phosphatase (PHP family) [Bogoriella caseilytica]